MFSQDPLHPSRQPEGPLPLVDPLLATLSLACLFLLIWPGLVLGLLLWRCLRGRSWLIWLPVIAIGVGLILLAWYLANPLRQVQAVLAQLDIQQPLRLMWRALPFWAATLTLAPLVAFIVELLRPKQAKERLLMEIAGDQARRQRLSQRAQQAVRRAAPDTVRGESVLGYLIEQDEKTSALRNWQGFKQWFTLPAQELAQHGAVIGGSGSGKTVSLLRIAYLAAKVYRWKVFFIDAKGDWLTAARFMALMKRAGARTALFPAQPYYGFRGDGRAIFNRLMAIEDYSEPFYWAAARKILYAVCSDPPSNSSELVARLEALDPFRLRLEKLKADTIAGVALRYSAFFEAIQGKLDGTWSYDDVDAAYLLLDGLALKEEARSLGRYLIEDFAHYASSRKLLAEHVLLIVDEYSALSTGTDASNLFERLRSFNASVLVSCQGYSGLGEGAERILDAAKFILLHRTPNPEPLISRAGRQQKITEAHRTVNEFASGTSTVQLEDGPAIEPNEPRRLETGEAILITKGHWSKIRVAPAPNDEQMEAESDEWLQALSAAHSLPSAYGNSLISPYDGEDGTDWEEELLPERL